MADQVDGQIGVLIVDRHRMVRRALAFVVASYHDFTLLGDVSDLSGGVMACRELRPDVTLVDVATTDGECLEVIQQLLMAHPTTRVVVLGDSFDQGLAHRVLRAGACAFLPKAFDADALVVTLRRASRVGFSGRKLRAAG